MKIIVIPGWQQNSEHWALVLDKLSQDYPSSIIDLPGFGKEKLISKNWGVKEYAQWVQEKILSDNPNERIFLIGHSFGGRIVCEIASKNPKWLEGLILYAAPLIYKPSSKIKFMKKMSSITPCFFKKAFTKLLPKDYKKVKDTELEDVFKKSVVYDQTEQLRSINIKTCLIWGEQDKDVPLKIGEEIHTQLKESTIEIVPKEEHNIHLNNPNILYGIIKNFITKN